MKQLIMMTLLLCSFAFGESKLIEKGENAPTFVLPGLEGSREYLRVWCGEKLMKPYINDVKHRVVLSFWSQTCVPCMKEIPELHRFAEKHADEPIKFFLINLDNTPVPELKQFVEEKGWSLPVLRDPYKNTAKKFGVSAIPTLYVISPDGKVEHSFTGIPEEMDADTYLESLIYGDATEEIAVTGKQGNVEEKK